MSNQYARKRANAVTRIRRRIWRDHATTSGEPGLLYLRLRLAPLDPRLKSRRVDIPLETPDERKAVQQAGYVVRTLARLGRVLCGDLAQDAAALAEPNRRRAGKKQDNGQKEFNF